MTTLVGAASSRGERPIYNDYQYNDRERGGVWPLQTPIYAYHKPKEGEAVVMEL